MALHALADQRARFWEQAHGSWPRQIERRAASWRALCSSKKAAKPRTASGGILLPAAMRSRRRATAAVQAAKQGVKHASPETQHYRQAANGFAHTARGPYGPLQIRRQCAASRSPAFSAVRRGLACMGSKLQHSAGGERARL